MEYLHSDENPDTRLTHHPKIYFHVVIDVGVPMNIEVLTYCVQAMENVITWALNLFTTQPLMCGVSLINSSVQHVLKQRPSSKKSFQIQQLKSVFDFVKTHASLPFQEFEDALHLSIHEILRDFREIQSGITGTHKLQLILLSRRDGQRLKKTVDNIQNAVSFQDVHRFQVVELRADNPAAPVSGGCDVIEVHWAALEGSPRLDAVLQRAWAAGLQPAALPLRLELPFPHELPSTQELECRATACLMDPLRLPSWAWNRFVLMSPDCLGCAPSGSTSGPTRLRVVSRLSSDGVCEARLFGMPLRVTSDTLDNHNAEMFGALCRTLLARDEYLVVKVQRGVSDDLGGHFVLMPGDPDSLLLKCIASSELALPLPPSVGINPRRFTEARVADCLDSIPCVENYRAEDFPSGLYRALKLNARFPTLTRSGRPQQRTFYSRRHQQHTPTPSPAPSPTRVLLPVPVLPSPELVYSSSSKSDFGGFDEALFISSDDSGDETCSSSSKIRGGIQQPDTHDAFVVDSAGHAASTQDTNHQLEPARSVESQQGRQPQRRAHKLGTGGHPALEKDFLERTAPVKRKKPQLTFDKLAAAASSISARKWL